MRSSPRIRDQPASADATGWLPRQRPPPENRRYAAHGGATPNEVWRDRLRVPLGARYRPPTRLPSRGRIEVVRYVRSNRRVDKLFGKRITVAEDQTHQYVRAIIKVRTKRVVVITLAGEIIYDGDYALSRVLR